MDAPVVPSFNYSTVLWDEFKAMPPKNNKVLIYCNGIMNDIKDAKESAKLISRAFDNKAVTICHNPTGLFGLINIDKRQALFEVIWPFFLRILIVQVLSGNVKLPVSSGESQVKELDGQEVLLFTHSHGAWLSLKALETESPEYSQEIENALHTIKEKNVLKEEQLNILRKGIGTPLNAPQRKRLYVYTFGGITMIPKNLASRVENYVCDLDFFATPIGSKLRGNTLGIVNIALHVWGSLNNEHPIINKIIDCYSDWHIENNQDLLVAQKKILQDRSLLDEFIHFEAYSQREISPDITKAIRLYFVEKITNPTNKISEDGEDTHLELSENRKKLFLECFNEYNILLTNGFSSNIEIITDGLLNIFVTGIAKFWSTSFENHAFKSYIVAMESIAKEHI